jgi:hypothetical protein
MRRTVKGNKGTDERNGNHDDQKVGCRCVEIEDRIHSSRGELLENEGHNQCDERNKRRPWQNALYRFKACLSSVCL